MPTLLQRINALIEDGALTSQEAKVFRMMERETRLGLQALAGELNLMVSDLLGTKVEVAKCRSSVRHAWDDTELDLDYTPMGLPEVFICHRCDTLKIQVYGLNNKKNGPPRYKYQKTYKIEGASRRIFSSEFDVVRRRLKLAAKVESLEAIPPVRQLETMLART